MGNEESREVPRDAARTHTSIQASSHFQPPTSQHTQQYPIGSPSVAGNNQPQAQPPGWVMPSSNSPNTASQNKVYPNLPPYNAIPQHTDKQPPMPQQPSAPPMFYPQAPNQFFAQRPIGSSITTTISSVPTMQPPVPSFNPYPQHGPQINNDIWSRGNTIPSNAFRAGQDTDGTIIYICRAFHDGDHLPGKVVPTHKCAYICRDGKEISKSEFQVLVGDQYRWVPANNGHVPAEAVEGGRTVDGEKLYIGRASYNRSSTPGKIHPSHRCLYIPYGGEEHRFSEYEVLVHSNYGKH